MGWGGWGREGGRRGNGVGGRGWGALYPPPSPQPPTPQPPLPEPQSPPPHLMSGATMLKRGEAWGSSCTRMNTPRSLRAFGGGGGAGTAITPRLLSCAHAATILAMQPPEPQAPPKNQRPPSRHLSGAQDEGHPRPALVVDQQLAGRKGGGLAAGGEGNGRARHDLRAACGTHPSTIHLNPTFSQLPPPPYTPQPSRDGHPRPPPLTTPKNAPPPPPPTFRGAPWDRRGSPAGPRPRCTAPGCSPGGGWIGGGGLGGRLGGGWGG